LVRLGNFKRIFDAAKVRVRAWEAADRANPDRREIPRTPASGDPLERDAVPLERK
jgi:hypothetical protein